MESDEDVTPVDDFCHVWEGDYSCIPQVEFQPYDQFHIRFEVEFTYMMAMDEDQEDCELPDYLSDNLRIETFSHQFWEPCKKLSGNNLAWDTIVRMLSRIGVPEYKQPFMIHKISTFADKIARRIENMSRKVLSINVSIGVIVNDPEEAHVLAVRESMQGEVRSKPASKEAIEKLDKIKIQDCEVDPSRCTICMEKYEKDLEATRLPCLHIYHGNCIVNWLGVSHVCPLCRYQLSPE